MFTSNKILLFRLTLRRSLLEKPSDELVRDLLGLQHGSTDNYHNYSDSREDQFTLRGCLFRNNCIRNEFLSYESIKFDIFNKGKP